MVDLTESIFFVPKVRYLRFSEDTAFLSFIFSLCGRRLRKGVESSESSVALLCFQQRTNERTNERSERKEKEKTKCFKDSDLDKYLYMIAAGLVREEGRGNMYSIELNRQPWERG